VFTNVRTLRVKAFRSLLVAYSRAFASGLARPGRAEETLEARGYLACSAPRSRLGEGSTIVGLPSFTGTRVVQLCGVSIATARQSDGVCRIEMKK